MYIGGMTNWDERDVQLDFSFLPEDMAYVVANSKLQEDFSVGATHMVLVLSLIHIYHSENGGSGRDITGADCHTVGGYHAGSRISFGRAHGYAGL